MINNNLSNDEKQVSTLENTTSIQPFADFNDWFASVVEEVKPELVVGIARGAIRLLQLQGVHRILSGTPIISNHALSFISDSELKSKRVLLFDDSVIFGSTMSNIKDYLINRGAIVFCASYVIDRHNFYGETEDGTHALHSEFRNLPIRTKHQMWPSAIRRHHNTLIRSILQKPSHYNLDFPTFYFKVPKYTAGDIPYLINLLRRTNIFRGLFDVSSSASNEHGIYRYTTLFKPLSWHLFPKNNGLFCRPYSKARITFVPQSKEIQITPLPQLTMVNSMVYEDIKFDDDTLLWIWKRLHKPYDRGDPFYHQALFRLLTSFVAIIMGKAITRQITLTLHPEFPVKQISLLEDDIRAVIGPANCQALKQIWSYIRRLSVVPGSPTEIDENEVVDIDEPIDLNLLHDVVDVWRTYPELKPCHNESVYEVFGKVFLTLHKATDSSECRRKNPDASRLEVGFSYEAIRQLLQKECGINFKRDEISLGMDVCIDNGQSVPKVILQDSSWLRAFYCGEGRYSHDIMQFKDAIHKGYSNFLKQKSAHPLSPFDMHKLCVTLKDLFPWLPISTRYYTFGKYAKIGKSETELISWLTDPNSGPLKIHTETEKDKEILLPNEDYKSCVRPTWQPDNSRDFYDAFQYITTVFSKLPSEAKLLLSTCRTHRHTYNAVAFEAHSWVNHAHGNFQKFLSGIRLSTDKITFTSEAISSLYWCIRYISEAWKKYDIFHKKFDTMLNRLRRAFVRQSPTAEHFWQYYVDEKGILDPSPDQEIENRFKFLMPLITQMSRLTTFITRAFVDLEILSLDELRQKFESEGVSLEHKEFRWLTEHECRTVATMYNEDIRQGRIPGLSIVKTELPLDMPPKGDNSVREWCRKTLETVQKCFDELSTSLQEFCPEYEVEEGDFPFSPDSTRRVLRDGSVERTFRDMYILTIDIIGSTDNERISEFKNRIISTFESYKRPDLYCEETGNDAYVVCSEDPIVLWDIAISIRLQGEIFEKTEGRFEGTRKGLSVGTLRIVERTDGHVIIKDDLSSHLPPRVFGILDGIDSYCEKNSLSRNAVIIIEEITAQRCQQELNLNLETNHPFWVKSKHFHGRCYILDLSNAETLEMEHARTPAEVRRELAQRAIHDLKNPTTAAQIFLKNLMDGLQNSPSITPEILDLAKKVRNQVNRISLLTETMQRLIYPLRNRRRNENINDLVQRVVLDSLPTSDCEVVFDLCKPDPMAAVDVDEIDETITQLAANAWKAMENKGKLPVKTQICSPAQCPQLVGKPDVPFVLISLTDSGPGVPDSVRRRLFQAGVSTTGGSGLGLYSVKMIVTEHDGDVWLENTGPNGSTFIIALPMRQLPSEVH